MRRRVDGQRKFTLAVFTIMIAALPGIAQTAPPSSAAQAASQKEPAPAPKSKRDSKIEDWKPALLPADALGYGSALEQHAPPKLKKWCEHYAQTEMPKQKIDPRAIMAVVDKEFASASDEARDATIFLVEYLAYKREDDEQRMLAARLRRMDDEAADITERMYILKDNQQKRLRSIAKGVGLSPQELVQSEEELQRMDQQLRILSDDRKVKIEELKALRRRVDSYLKVMSVTHPRMNGVPPEVLRTMP